MRHQHETLAKQYQLRFAGRENYRDRVWQTLCEKFFSRYIAADSKVLDLGSGWGEFINNINAVDKFAMDLNSSSGEHLSPGVTCIHQDCSEPWKMASGFLDVVFTSNFLEHLNDKASIERTIAEALRCLKTGGLLICMGPNVKYVGGSYWDFWDHHIPLTEQSCSELLRLNSFGIERCIPRFLPFSMSNGSNPPVSLINYYLQLPILWPLFGKQFLVIGRKQSTENTQGEL